jgi:pimeloyl-ACP methyl ester carboxylesterase
MPTLVISGGQSPLPTRRICFHLARMIPEVTARTVATAGHMLPVTHVHEILPLIADHCGARRRHRAERDRERVERVSA